MLPPLVDASGDLTPEQSRRYSRHLILQGFGVDAQKRLNNARVLCVGAGGLGSPALMYLAASGVGTLGIVEFDLVEESNLARQIIYRESDIGKSKAESAKATILTINPNVNVQVHSKKLDTSNVMEIFSHYDLIIDGTDNFATRYLINDAAVLLAKPYIWGSIYRFDGEATIFWSKYGPCYRCLYPAPPPPGSVPNCAESGVLGVLCGSIGTIQSTEAIKLITGIGEPIIGSLILYNALAMEYQKISIKKDPECPLCGKNPTQKTLLDNYEEFCGVASAITVTDLKTKMDKKEKFFLVDVREPYEWDIVRIPGAVLIPVNEFYDGNALTKLPRNIPIILHCRSGVRSATCLAVLHAAGFADATHVMGGVLAWAQEIDPSLPTY